MLPKCKLSNLINALIFLVRLTIMNTVTVFSVKLKHFQKFLDTTEALAATTASVEGKLNKSLKKVSFCHFEGSLSIMLV